MQRLQDQSFYLIVEKGVDDPAFPFGIEVSDAEKGLIVRFEQHIVNTGGDLVGPRGSQVIEHHTDGTGLLSAQILGDQIGTVVQFSCRIQHLPYRRRGNFHRLRLA